MSQKYIGFYRHFDFSKRECDILLLYGNNGQWWFETTGFK